jgi:hypothetical protein
LTGVAENITLSPRQTVFVAVVTLTLGVTEGRTVILIVLEVALRGLAQVELLVITTLTASLLPSELLVKTSEFVPAFVPFTFH